MPIPATKYIWFNGKLVPWEKATVHVLSHALHYGSSVFEGVRAYETPRGPAIFRLRDHTHRLFDSAKIYRINLPFTEEQINHGCREVISQNGLARGAYLRPVAFRGYGEIGVVPKIDPPVEVAIAGWEWGKYLGAAEDEGVDVCVSSWQRVAPNTIPAMAKAGGNYLSSQLIGLEAKRLGFVEGIGLASDGTVSEGAGENLFLVKDGVLYTPGIAHSLLAGITRHTVITLAKELGIEVREIAVPREMPVHRRRAVLHRHRHRSRGHPLGGRHPDRQRQARAHHRKAAGGVLRSRAGQDGRQARLARLRGHELSPSRSGRLIHPPPVRRGTSREAPPAATSRAGAGAARSTSSVTCARTLQTGSKPVTPPGPP